MSKSDHSENKREDDSVKECEEVPLPPPLAREVDVPTDLHEAQFEDEETEKAEVCDDERSTESTLLKTESKTENTEDEHVNFEHTKASDLVEKISEGGTVDATEEKEETLEVQTRYILQFTITSFTIYTSTKTHSERKTNERR